MTEVKRHKPYYHKLKRLKGKELNFFISGFVDGEASFSVSMTRAPWMANKSRPWKWILNPVFNVYQHGDNIDILILMRDHVFKTGRIHKKTSPYNVYTYSIENHRTLDEKIVPFFRKYPLATKAADFEKFAKVIAYIQKGHHKTLRGFKEILDIAFTMNANGKSRIYSKEYIFKTLPEQFNRT